MAVIRHSSFVIRHSSFVIRHSSFVIPHSPSPLTLACDPKLNACPTQNSYLIGVSGGRDSVALLHGLVAAGYSSLFVCHLDHQLRPESATDAQFVQTLAEKYSLPAFIESVQVHAPHQSLEAAARQARYAFFSKVARHLDCPRLILAHHADDQVETFLFNLFRGGGTGGLGMRPDHTRSIDGTPLQILRPLLGVWRSDIDAYVSTHQLDYREDASNLDPQFSRNRLRHQLIPQLEATFGRNIRKTLWRTAEILRAEDQWLRTLIGPPPELLPVCKLRLMPIAQQRRLIHTWLHHHQVSDISFDHIENVRSLLTQRRAKINLPGGVHVRRRQKLLFVERPGP